MNPALKADTEEPWTPTQVCAFLQNTVNEATLAVWRSRGQGPRYFKSGRKPLYRPSAVREWCAERERGGGNASTRRAQRSA